MKKAFCEQDVLFLMEISHFLGCYYLKEVYNSNLSLNKTSSLLNTWSFELFEQIKDIDLNDILNNPPKYGFSGNVWRFEDIVKEFGKNKLETHISMYTINPSLFIKTELTHKQIEAEGWNYMTVFDIGKIYSKDFTGYWWKELYHQSKDITISKNNCKGEKKILYQGECEDINSFRVIMKLLKI